MTKNIEQILQDREATQEEVLAVFDKLKPADCAFMIGEWKGSEIETGHRADGLLESSGWHGKKFVDYETVHPLIMTGPFGGLFSLKPHPALLSDAVVPVVKLGFLKPLFPWLSSLLSTKRGMARLRMVEYRGKANACMIYDELPVYDHFRKIDEDTVMGIMDQKGKLNEPYIFILKRDTFGERMKP